jgi:hypothetical protein
VLVVLAGPCGEPLNGLGVERFETHSKAHAAGGERPELPVKVKVGVLLSASRPVRLSGTEK